MIELLFIVGLGIAIIGRINIGSLNAEGPTARAAGFMLMMPVLVVLVLSFALDFITGGDLNAMSWIQPFLLFLQLPVIVVCVGVAYWLIRSQNRTAPPTPSEPASTAEDTPTASTIDQTVDTPTTTPEPAPPPPPQVGRPPASRKFPNVMGIKDAASYLNTSEQRVMQLIEEGRITAARINYRYQISRRVLDEFIEDQSRSAADS